MQLLRLIDPAANKKRAIITLTGGGHDSAAPQRVNGIAVGKKADRLWFLQTACWGDKTKAVGKEVQARYIIHFDDGSSVDFDQRNQIEIADWWNPVPLPSAKVAWSGRNAAHAPIGIYVTPWENPYPDKTITTIDALGNLGSAQIVLLAITGGVDSGSPNTMKLISQWNMDQIANSQIKNSVPDSGVLRADIKTQPQLIQMNGENHLRFRNGQRLTGDTRKIPGLADGGPMRLDVTLVVEEKSPGYLGGIYEGMNYGKKGFRLSVGSNLKLSVEIFFEDSPPKFLKSKAPLELGGTYSISIDFDGQYAKIMINDKLDSLIECSPPSAYGGLFQIGNASGSKYHFHGIIKEMSFHKPN